MPDIDGRPTRPSGAARPKHGATDSRRTTANGSRRPSPTLDPTASRELSYEDVDTSLIPPRPRLYGMVGGEVIEEVWKESRTRCSSEVQYQ